MTAKRMPKQVHTLGRTIAWIEERSIPEPNTGCWLWLGFCNHEGYGYASMGRSYAIAHRMSYAIACGEFDPCRVVMHRCDNPPCVNPGHLRLGTVAENNRDRSLKGRTNRKDPIPYADRMRGSAHVRAKLNEEQVAEIRRRLDAGEQRMVLAREFGVGWTTMDHLAAGRTWKHVRSAGAVLSVEER